MSTHKEVVYSAQVTKRFVFNVDAERERIAHASKSDIVDGIEYCLPAWVIEKMTAMCDALEEGDIAKVNEIYHENLYDNPRHNDTVVAEYFPMIVDDILSCYYDDESVIELENIQEVMD